MKTEIKSIPKEAKSIRAKDIFGLEEMIKKSHESEKIIEYVLEKGEYEIRDELKILKGMELWIQPSTILLFKENTGITVEGGKLNIMGEENNPIIIHSIRCNESYGWSNILIRGNSELYAQYAEIGGGVGRKYNQNEDDRTKFGGCLEVDYYNGYVPSVQLNHVLMEHNRALDGGAIHIMGGEVKISNSIFKYNKAARKGGAIDLYGGNLYIENSDFSWNDAIHGKAIYLAGNVIIENSKFITNRILGTSIHADLGSLKLVCNSFYSNEKHNLYINKWFVSLDIEGNDKSNPKVEISNWPRPKVYNHYLKYKERDLM